MHLQYICSLGQLSQLRTSLSVSPFPTCRNGLRSMSNTHYMSTGTAYGSGLYLSTHGGTSIGYAHAGLGRQQGKLKKGFRCLALCEVLVEQDTGDMDKGNTIIVVPAEDVPNVFLRYLLVVEGYGDAARSWVVKQGTQLQQADGETVDLGKHMQDCVDAHKAQQQREVEQTWRTRADLVNLILPTASSSNGCDKHELPAGSGTCDDDYGLVYEDEDEEADEEDEVFEYLEEVKLGGSSENKASSNGLGPDRTTPERKGAKPSAPAHQPVTNTAPGPSALSTHTATASRAPASTPSSSQRGAASSSAPAARSAPGAAGAKAGGARSQSAAKAVQQEFRKLSKLQVSCYSCSPVLSVLRACRCFLEK